MMKVTALLADVEITAYSDESEVAGRSVKRILALESEIPIQFRQWLLDRAPAPGKEG